MRSRVEKPSPVPLRYRRYRAGDGWSSPSDWAVKRQQWAEAQPPVRLDYTDHSGNQRSYLTTPLGDLTDLIRARREARLLDD